MARARISIEVAVFLALLGVLALATLHGIREKRSVWNDLEGMAVLPSPDGELRIGEPDAFENLAIYPIFARAPRDIGPVISLPAALAKSVAEVRELGASGEIGARHAGGATVGQLVVENKGDVPIYVLAGTIVKGGNQDRQIGQDFIVAAKSSVPVDAFCVEHGRWTPNREGAPTAGKFAVSGEIATTKVRIAGQYNSNQGEVWDEVGKVNAANGKDAPTGTLLASLEDEAFRNRRAALAKRITERLAERRPNEHLVGFGYAVDGKVKGVRWFTSAKLFATFRDVIVNTAASDALATPNPTPAPVQSSDSVVKFLAEVDRAKSEERATPAENVNAYRKAKIGASSETKLKATDAAKAAPPVSRDYVAY